MQPQILLGNETHKNISDVLQKNRHIVLSGASNETAKALLTSTILHYYPQKSLLVTEKEEGVEALSHWLHFFNQTAHHLQPVENEHGEIIPNYLQNFLLFMQGDLHEIFLFLNKCLNNTRVKTHAL